MWNKVNHGGEPTKNKESINKTSSKKRQGILRRS